MKFLILVVLVKFGGMQLCIASKAKIMPILYFSSLKIFTKKYYSAVLAD